MKLGSLRHALASIQLRRRSGVALVALAASLALAPAASASSTTLGSGTNARVAIDSSGAAHVAWIEATSPQPVVQTCTIAFGGGACANTHSFTIKNGDQIISPYVFVTPGKIFVVVGDYNGAGGFMDVFESDDNGATFQPSRTIGNVPPDDAALDPATGRVFGISGHGQGVTSVQAAPLAGPKQTTSATLTPAQPSDVTQWTIGVGGSQVVGAWNGIVGSAGGVFYGYWKGTGDVNDGSTWATGSLGDGGTDIALAGGPSGVYLLEEIPGQGGAPSLRRWNGTGFGALAAADCGDTSNFGAGIQNEWLDQDAGGRLHLVYVASTGSGGHNTLRYVLLAGGSQSAPMTLDDTIDPSAPHVNTHVAANASGQGFAVWQTGFGDSSQIRGTWLPSPLPVTSGCPGGSPGGGENQVSTSVPGAQVTVSTPAACVAHGSALTVKLSIKTTGKKAKAKFARADFYVDGGVKKVKGHGKHKKKLRLPNATVKHLPAQVSLATAKLKSGTHTLLIRLAFKQKVKKKGHTVTVTLKRTIKVTFKIC